MGKKTLGVLTGKLKTLGESPIGCEAPSQFWQGHQGSSSICERFCLYMGLPVAVGLCVCKPDEDPLTGCVTLSTSLILRHHA